MEQEDKVQRAEEAQRVLKSPLFEAAFNDTRQALLNGIASLDNLSDPRAVDLHRMLKGLDKVRRCLEVHIDTGKLAAKELEGKARLVDRFLKRA